MLLGLYMLEKQGDIFINRMPMETLDMVNIRKGYIGISEQDPVMLTGCMLDNINPYSAIDAMTTETTNKVRFYIELLDMLKHENLFFDEAINNKTSDTANTDNNSFANLSGGEKQKLSILRLLLKNPDVMIFDEPTSAMDITTSKRFLEHLKEIKGNKIIIIITHDNLAREICDEFLCL